MWLISARLTLRHQESKRQQKDARNRAELILRVRSGQITATEAANLLEVSRKTYYKWEKRALEGMVDALEERTVGRPSEPEDPEKIKLKQQLAVLEREQNVLKQKLEIKELLSEMDLNIRSSGTMKKK